MKAGKQVLVWILMAAMLCGMLPVSAAAGEKNLLADAVVSVSSEQEDHVANNEPTGPSRYLNDGDYSTRWAALDGGESWIKFDLGAVKEVDTLTITWEPAYPSSFEVLVSQDDQEYVSVHQENLSAKPEAVPLPIEQSCQYIKIALGTAAAGYPVSIYEVTATEVGKKIVSLDEVTAETVVGTEPELPKKVTAHYDDETTEELKVDWDRVDPASYGMAGEFTVEGAVEGTDLSAVCIVTVLEAADEAYIKLAKKEVGGRVVVPYEAGADAQQIAEAATQAVRDKLTYDVEAEVAYREDRYVLYLSKGEAFYTLDPFAVTVTTPRDESGRYEELDERIALARKIGAEGAILLKNEAETLPLLEEDNVAVFGRMQIDTIRGGLGAAYMDPAYEVNVLDGLRNAGVAVDEELASVYETWCSDPANKKEEVIYTSDRFYPEMPLEETMVAQASERNNKAVVVIGRIVGENNDMQYNAGGYLLTPEETAMLELVTRYFDQVAVVYNNGVVASMEFVEELGVESLLFMGYGGQEGGNYVADVLTARVTPSGKLTETVAKSYEDYPTYVHGNFSLSTTQLYTEDIYSGYRYFEQFDPDYETVRYPFGYGLSYTDFALSDVAAEQVGTHIEVRATVTNTGDTYSGREVVQVYYSAPQMGEDGARLSKPGKVLAAFDKTGLLAPGESETLTMSFPISDMRSYDDTGVTGHVNAWVMEAGDYEIYVGNSIQDAGPEVAVDLVLGIMIPIPALFRFPDFSPICIGQFPDSSRYAQGIQLQ